MAKITSLDDLRRMRENLAGQMDVRERSDDPEGQTQIKVAMATCGIASGAREVMNRFIKLVASHKIPAIVTQTGCMGYCHAEPTVEITRPGGEPVVFGHVDVDKVETIVDKYILKGELIDGVIPANYRTIEDK